MHALAIAVLLLLGSAFPSFAREAAPTRSDVPRDAAELRRTMIDEHGVLLSTSSAERLMRRSSAGPDTFDLYGGPSRRLRDPDGIPNNGDEYVEGKFEDAGGTLPRGLSDSPNDWTSEDWTKQPIYWRVDTFNAANLGGHGAGNRAAWIGLPAGVEATAGWTDAPGYGNNWANALIFESPVSDPSIGQTVDLDFVFNIDTELSYDFLYVEYDLGGMWIKVADFDGTNKDGVTGDFAAPGLRYSELGAAPIVYTGDDYSTDGTIRLRLAFYSDGAYSDEDGLFDGDGGAQVDDLVVTTSEGVFSEDFEGAGPYLWNEPQPPFAGDFANVFLRASDLDPCASNDTPQLNFIDSGQVVRNGPGASGATSTGGSTSSTWNYGVPGAWVMNYTGGLDAALGEFYVDMAVRSPAFDWDLPGALDDGPDVMGAFLAFDVYRHQPLINGIFYNWELRFFANGEWTNWRNRSSAYYSLVPEYQRFTFEVTDLVPSDVEQVQILLRAYDWSNLFGFPGADATPAPFYDNVRFSKVRVGGPVLLTRTVDLANDGFSVSNEIAATTQAERDLLDVRFDMARDVSSGVQIVPGDSVIVDARAIIPGTEVADLRMVWALRQNDVFEAAIRALPARTKDENVTAGVDAFGTTIWTGEVVADSSRSAGSGVWQQDRYFVDLPDEDFLYPGDVLHYYLRATDSEGRVTTLPADIDGFGAWDADGRSAFSRTWTVRALPSVQSTAPGAHPEILVYNDFGRRGSEDEFLLAFAQLGMVEGLHFDTYTVQGASSAVSNGLGSAGDVNVLGDRRGHGATVEQLDGYSTILYFSGNLNTRLISDGSDDGANDKSDDLALLTAWKDRAGDRATIHFGDGIVSALIEDAPVMGGIYVFEVMGVQLMTSDVEAALGGQTTPRVRALGAGPFAIGEFVLYGGCPALNTFDHIEPGSSAERAYGFVDPSDDSVIADVAAGVAFVRSVGVDTKVDLTFPFGFASVIDPISRAVPGVGSRALFLEDVLGYVGAPNSGGVATGAPSPPRRCAAWAVACRAGSSSAMMMSARGLNASCKAI